MSLSSRHFELHTLFSMCVSMNASVHARPAQLRQSCIQAPLDKAFTLSASECRHVVGRGGSSYRSSVYVGAEKFPEGLGFVSSKLSKEAALWDCRLDVLGRIRSERSSQVEGAAAAAAAALDLQSVVRTLLRRNFFSLQTSRLWQRTRLAIFSTWNPWTPRVSLQASEERRFQCAPSSPSSDCLDGLSGAELSANFFVEKLWISETLTTACQLPRIAWHSLKLSTALLRCAGCRLVAGCDLFSVQECKSAKFRNSSAMGAWCFALSLQAPWDPSGGLMQGVLSRLRREQWCQAYTKRQERHVSRKLCLQASRKPHIMKSNSGELACSSPHAPGAAVPEPFSCFKDSSKA